MQPARVIAVAVLAVVASCAAPGSSESTVSISSDSTVLSTTTTSSTSTSTTSSSSTTSTVAVTSTTLPDEQASLWSRPCADQIGTTTAPPADPYAGRTFGPLAPEPGLRILYPLGPMAANYGDPVSSVGRVPGGVIISIQGYSPVSGGDRILAVVNDTGSVRWRRCLGDVTGWSTVLDVDRGVIDVEVTPTGQAEGDWWAFDLLTGESHPETERSAADLAAAMAPSAEPDVRFDYTALQSTLRRVDAAGKVLWRRDDLYDTAGEGFRTSLSQSNGHDEVTVVRACVGQPIDYNVTGLDQACPFALVGVSTKTGATRWQLDGSYSVSLVADGYAIVTEIPTITASSMLVDVFTGEVITGGISAEPAAFLEECCGGYDYNRVEANGAVAWTIATDVLNVWYPSDLPGPGTVVDLFGPSSTPRVVARFQGMTDQPVECASALCWQLHAIGSGFSPAQSVTASCWIDDGSGWVRAGDDSTVVAAADGSVLAPVDCHIGQHAGKVKVTIDGTDSNVLTS